MKGAMSDDRNIKRKLRELKKLEIRLRFNGNAPPGRALVWDGFFGRGKDGRAAKYPPEALAALGREGFKRAVEAYFALVYYELYREAGISRAAGAYDPALLARLGLPYSAGEAQVKERFRALAKLHHPDAGGDPEAFISLMRDYRALTGK